MNRLALASQDLYSGENSFLGLPWHLKKPALASQHPSVIKTALSGLSIT